MRMALGGRNRREAGTAAYSRGIMKRSGDTSLGGESGKFPSTIWHAIDTLKKDPADPGEIRAQIVQRYWKPVYACIRVGWNLPNEDAKDLTQEFFVFLLEGDALRMADPTRGRFRTYLKTVLRNFLAGEHRKNTRVKRGGGTRRISLDAAPEDLDVPRAEGGPEEVFDREWARTLVEECLADTQKSFSESGRENHWRILEAHDLASGDAPSYPVLAERFGVTENQVKHMLQETRKRLRDSLIQRIRDYATEEQEVWEELEYLMGLWRG